MKNYCLLFTFVFVCNLLLHAEDSIMYNYDATMCVNGKWRFYTCCIAWRHELCADDGRSAAHQKSDGRLCGLAQRTADKQLRYW